jgi:hypothetical protein
LFFWFFIKPLIKALTAEDADGQHLRVLGARIPSGEADHIRIARKVPRPEWLPRPPDFLQMRDLAFRPLDAIVEPVGEGVTGEHGFTDQQQIDHDPLFAAAFVRKVRGDFIRLFGVQQALHGSPSARPA